AEYKRLRSLARAIAEADRPPFTVTRNGDKVVKERAGDVLAFVLEDAKKEFTITRFKGLGEMNPAQLWETTMNAETRTLLQVRLCQGCGDDRGPSFARWRQPRRIMNRGWRWNWPRPNGTRCCGSSKSILARCGTPTTRVHLKQ